MNNIYSAIFAAVATVSSATTPDRGTRVNLIHDAEVRAYEEKMTALSSYAMKPITGRTNKEDILDIDFYVPREKYNDVLEFLKARFIKKNFPGIDREDVKEQSYRDMIESQSPIKYKLQPYLKANNMSEFKIHELAVLTEYFPVKDYDYGQKSSGQLEYIINGRTPYDPDGTWESFDFDELPGWFNSEELASAEVYSRMQKTLAIAAYESTDFPLKDISVSDNDIKSLIESRQSNRRGGIIFLSDYPELGKNPYHDVLNRIIMALEPNQPRDPKLPPQIPVNVFERIFDEKFEDFAKKFSNAMQPYNSKAKSLGRLDFKPQYRIQRPGQSAKDYQEDIESSKEYYGRVNNTPKEAAIYLLINFKEDKEFIASMNFGESKENVPVATAPIVSGPK